MNSDEKFYAQRDANFKDRVYRILFDDPSGHSDEEVLNAIAEGIKTKLTENEYDIVVWSLEQMWLDFDPQSEDDAASVIKKLREITDFVPVEEPSHRHVRKDLDLL